MSQYLFTYGTLQPGMAPNDIAPTVDKLHPVAEGFVRGVLYDLGDFPGAVLNSRSKQRISGKVFRLSDDASVLQQLDEYEEFDPSSPNESLFVRTLHSVELTDGRSLLCWIYVYNRKPESSRIVKSGRFQKKLAS
jgi:gamma-glutamylcyclotransferase (GGCT)/AIG2-like uncharacterized protein YtfP